MTDQSYRPYTQAPSNANTPYVRYAVQRSTPISVTPPAGYTKYAPLHIPLDACINIPKAYQESYPNGYFPYKSFFRVPLSV